MLLDTYRQCNYITDTLEFGERATQWHYVRLGR